MNEQQELFRPCPKCQAAVPMTGSMSVACIKCGTGCRLTEKGLVELIEKG